MAALAEHSPDNYLDIIHYEVITIIPFSHDRWFTSSSAKFRTFKEIHSSGQEIQVIINNIYEKRIQTN